MDQVLTFCVSMLLQLVTWLSTVTVSQGVTVLAFLAATFALGLMVRKFINV